MLKIACVRSVSVSSEVALNESSNFRLATVTIENWISDSFFAPQPEIFKNPSLPLIIGLVGNCSLIKNHSQILTAVSNRPEFKVFHIGNESEAPLEELELLNSLETKNKLIRFGEQPRVQDILLQCDLFAMPSTHEGFGMALAEALALGIPCLISEAKGLFWAHDLPGVMVVTNATGWNSTLQNLNLDLLSEERVNALTARDIYREKWSAARGVSEYVRVYSA
jgi:glycosyltransferase involved in cell wall biosynthesis